ncbi:aldo-keto reductase [Penicillium subrubescens]|uniref:aldo-keto reductase n=1 Tax=Penicillium subrubescens TaxID=1316194 RepID=UPI0025452134|nr:aldo-keto reductase [Penicillium subrubescens]KAJ5912047.1 aldo-keto reductase [Penicillium subrubescens]
MASELPPLLNESRSKTKASYKRLGSSGLWVSVPILGGMSIGSSEFGSWILEEDKALPLLKAAYDRGLNTWDTSNNYSNGVSEEIIGKAIKHYNIPRNKLVILTKCWAPVSEHENVYVVPFADEMRQDKEYVNQFGLSRQAIFNSVNASLQRLGTDYIDLFQIHRFDHNTPIEETMEALHDLVRSGKIRYIGASSMRTYQFAMMQFCAEKHGWTKFVSMQNQYSLIYREEEREMNRFCNETGVGLIPWSPLDAGRLARPLQQVGATYRLGNTLPSDVLNADAEIINRVEELAKKKNWTMSQVALAWVSRRVASPIVGFSSVERIDEALEYGIRTLTLEEEAYLGSPYVPKEVGGHD